MVIFRAKAILFLLVIFQAVPCLSFDPDLKNTFKNSQHLNFDAYEDSVCFRNAGFYEHTGYSPLLRALGHVADQKGACQGIVAMAAAVKKNVIFRPNHKKMSDELIQDRLFEAQKLHYNNCSKKIYIDGHANMRELCNAHESALRNRALEYNFQIAQSDILKYSWSFFNLNSISTDSEISNHLKEHLTSMYNDLKNGVYPLMLVRTHVTLVIGMAIEHDEDGNPRRIELTHYDPNDVMSSDQDFRYRNFNISAEGQISGPLIWNITARPLTQISCWW